MTEDVLKENILSISGKEAVLKLIDPIINNEESINALYKLTSDSNHKIKWRSAWVFEHLYFINPDQFSHFLPKLIKRLPTEESDAIKRHFCKILSFSKINHLIDGTFINTCFNWLMSEKIALAVKAHCMQILHNITVDYPDLEGELIQVIESQFDNNSVGFKNRGKKIIKAINKKRSS